MGELSGVLLHPGVVQRASLARADGSLEEELKQIWARKMKELLLEMKAEVERAKALGQHALDVLVLARLLRRYDEILTEGYLANPPPPPSQKRTAGRPKQSPARNLLDRLSQRKWAVLRFLHDFAVPFDNNQAERDLRMSHPSSKRSLDASAPKVGWRCFVAFAVTSQPYENKGSNCCLHSITPLRVIPFFPLFHDPSE